MDQKPVPVVTLIRYTVIAEGNIANGNIEEAVRKRGCFISLYGDVGVLIELLCNTSCNAVEFHAVEPAARHAFGEQAEEIADTAGGFQNIAHAEAHLFNRSVHRFDDCGTCIVCVQYGSTSGFVFLWGQGFVEFPELICPRCVAFLKYLRQTAPAHVPGKDFLFFGRCKALFKLDSLQCPYRIHVHAKLRFRAAMTEGVVRNAEVGFLGRFCRLPLLGTNGLNNNIVGQVVFLCGNDFNCFGYRPGLWLCSLCFGNQTVICGAFPKPLLKHIAGHVLGEQGVFWVR